MSDKVDFSKKKTNNNKKNKKVKILVIAVISVLVIYILIQSIIRAYKSLPKPVPEDKKIRYSVSEYDSLEEILARFNCKLISKEETNELLKVYLSFNVGLYTNNQSNESYFLNMCKIIAEFEKFKNFQLIDTEKDINIEITCENTNIVEIKINGDVNYYLNKESEINSKKETSKEKNFTIQSRELQQLIDGGWKDSAVEWGTQDSTFNDYNIFFDEGIQYKNVSREVFNVIFTQKYNGQVAGGLNANSTVEEVEVALGEPAFALNKDLYGYLGENNYLFFDFVNKQISIYPVVKITSEEEKELQELIKQMNNTLDVKRFASKLTDLWIDFDEYNYNSNYVDLKYTLRGVELNIYSDSLKNGIFIYQNYSGNRNIQDLENVYIKSEDFVFKKECDRHYLERELYYGASLQNNEESELYKIEYVYDEEENITSVKFLAKDKLLVPNIELKEDVYTLVWKSNYEVLYSIKNIGIYYYNLQTNSKQKLLTGSDDFCIHSYNNKILSYDDKTIEIKEE